MDDVIHTVQASITVPVFLVLAATALYAFVLVRAVREWRDDHPKSIYRRELRRDALTTKKWVEAHDRLRSR